MQKTRKALALSSLLFFPIGAPAHEAQGQDHLQKLLQNSKARQVLERIITDATDGKYDYINHSLRKETIDEMTSCVYLISHERYYEKTTYVYDTDGKATEKKEPFVYATFGSAVLYKKAEKEKKLLFITAKHFLALPAPPAPKDKQGRQLVQYTYVTSLMKLIVFRSDNLTIPRAMRTIAASPVADVALLEADGEVESEVKKYKTSPPLGNSDELSYATLIYAVSFPSAVTKMFGEGLVTSPGDSGRTWDDANFWSNVLSNLGSSGGAAYAMRDGKPELIGIFVAKRIGEQGMNVFVRINHVKELLKDKNVPGYFRENP